MWCIRANRKCPFSLGLAPITAHHDLIGVPGLQLRDRLMTLPTVADGALTSPPFEATKSTSFCSEGISGALS